MNNDDILELMYLVISCENNLDSKWNHQFDEVIEMKCDNFCKKHNIKISHGTAFKELRHKTYYYKNKCIGSIIKDGIDLYELRQHKIVTDKEIVEKLLRSGGK